MIGLVSLFVFVKPKKWCLYEFGNSRRSVGRTIAEVDISPVYMRSRVAGRIIRNGLFSENEPGFVAVQSEGVEQFMDTCYGFL